MKTKLGCFVLAGLAASLALSLSPALGREPEAIWREVGKFGGEEKRTLLLSKAKAEGEVVWYANISVDSLGPLREDFQKRYPKVKIKIWRGSGARTSNRILTEARAGHSAVDVIGPGNENLPIMMKAGLVGRFHSPERRFYPDIYKDQQGYWTSYAYNVVAKRSPDPYAAALLVDYVLSERGQKILAKNGWYSGRRGIKLKYPEIDTEKRRARVLLLRPEDADQLGKKYFQLRERFLLRR